MFLIESYFDEFVENDNELSQLYKDRNEDVLVFLQLLRKKLSNMADKKISTLGEAKKCLNKNKHEPKYFRTKII